SVRGVVWRIVVRTVGHILRISISATFAIAKSVAVEQNPLMPVEGHISPHRIFRQVMQLMVHNMREVAFRPDPECAVDGKEELLLIRVGYRGTRLSAKVEVFSQDNGKRLRLMEISFRILGEFSVEKIKVPDQFVLTGAGIVRHGPPRVGDRQACNDGYTNCIADLL